MNIAIIPARSGSKRIKNKNILMFNKRPMIAHIIKKLKKSKIFDKIIVSTDSKKISTIANKYGAETPFIRPSKLSGDTATSISVVKHAIKFLIYKNIKIENICMVYATAPHIKTKNLKLGLYFIRNLDVNFVFPASKLERKIKKSFFVNPDFYISKLKKRGALNYLDSGQFYWAKYNTWLKNRSVFIEKSKIINISPLENIDLNTNKDLKKLRQYFKLK